MDHLVQMSFVCYRRISFSRLSVSRQIVMNLGMPLPCHVVELPGPILNDKREPGGVHKGIPESYCD